LTTRQILASEGIANPIDPVAIDRADIEAASRPAIAVMLLQPTNPVRPIGLVREAMSRFATEPCDSLVAVSRRSLKLGNVVDGRYIPGYAFGTPSRDMPPVWRFK